MSIWLEAKVKALTERVEALERELGMLKMERDNQPTASASTLTLNGRKEAKRS